MLGAVDQAIHVRAELRLIDWHLRSLFTHGINLERKWELSIDILNFRFVWQRVNRLDIPSMSWAFNMPVVKLQIH
jgi:hypothetical protein